MAMTEQITPYATAIVWGDTTASHSRFRERRTPQRQADRQALVRLRLIEFVAADHLPPDLMQELTAAIDGVITIVRGDHP